MIPALPEPAKTEFHLAAHLKDTTRTIDYYTATQLEQYARDYHAAHAELVAAKEREACLEIVYKHAWGQAPQMIAAAIRARSSKEVVG